MDNTKPNFVCGGAAGLAGTVALELVAWPERHFLGREPVYAPEQIARRLFRAQRSAACGVGEAMRFTYGPLLGLLFARGRSRLPRSSATAGAFLAETVLAFELIALPAVGATPSVRHWGAREVAFHAVQTALFGLTTALVYDRLIAANPRSRHCR